MIPERLIGKRVRIARNPYPQLSAFAEGSEFTVTYYWPGVPYPVHIAHPVHGVLLFALSEVEFLD